MRNGYPFAAGALAALVAGVGVAAEAEDVNPTSGGTELEEIVITAQKRPEKLQDVTALDADTLAAEVKKARRNKKSLSVAEMKALKEEHTRSVVPLQVLAAEARQLERRVADLVNAAYGLTAEEVALMWRTAPPRMPGEPPGQ